jgi:hypothetical protein
MFSHYSKNGPLYILINKNIKNDRDVFKKLQFHFHSNQFMDTLDRPIKVTNFFKENPELKEFFKKKGEIDAGFEIEHMLVTKEEGLKLLQTTKNKIDLINRKGFDFFKKFLIEIGAAEEFTNTILNDKEFIKSVFKKDLFDDLIEFYKEMGVVESGLKTIKSLPWLGEWIMDAETKPETIQKFIFSISENMGAEGKSFVKHLLERGGVVWNALLQPNKNKISHYFNMLSSRQSLGNAGLKIAKEMLKNKSVVDELKSKGVSTTTINMLNKFYSMLSEAHQAHTYLRNILR